jgi:hypothetical protein
VSLNDSAAVIAPYRILMKFIRPNLHYLVFALIFSNRQVVCDVSHTPFVLTVL